MAKKVGSLLKTTRLYKDFIAPRRNITPHVFVECCWLAGHCVCVLTSVYACVKISKDGVWREVGNYDNSVIILLADKGHEAVWSIVVNLDKRPSFICRL